jgi:multidrug efflux pump subunit AcrA (membrane-fusion protein)
MIRKRLSVWLAVAGVLFTVVTVLGARQRQAPPPPLIAPPQNPYQGTVAAAGIIEAVNENVRIGPPLAGLVTNVYVTVGERAKAGAPLFQLDDRELLAQLTTREAAIPSERAKVEEQRIRVKDLEEQHGRLQAVHDRRAVSEDDLKRSWYALEMARRAVIRAQADLEHAIAQRDATRRLLDRLTIRAPRAGDVLQVNIRAGEYAKLDTAEPLMLLGATQELQIRADVDEVNAPLVKAGSPAVAYLKGDTAKAIALRFARIEPFILPKKSLTGDNAERVDTRVLQVIYRFDPPSFPVYVGQQVDVFIQRAGGAQSGTGDTRPPTPPASTPRSAAPRDA